LKALFFFGATPGAQRFGFFGHNRREVFVLFFSVGVFIAVGFCLLGGVYFMGAPPVGAPGHQGVFVHQGGVVAVGPAGGQGARARGGGPSARGPRGRPQGGGGPHHHPGPGLFFLFHVFTDKGGKGGTGGGGAPGVFLSTGRPSHPPLFFFLNLFVGAPPPQVLFGSVFFRGFDFFRDRRGVGFVLGGGGQRGFGFVFFLFFFLSF